MTLLIHVLVTFQLHLTLLYNGKKESRFKVLYVLFYVRVFAKNTFNDAGIDERFVNVSFIKFLNKKVHKFKLRNLFNLSFPRLLLILTFLKKYSQFSILFIFLVSG